MIEMLFHSVLALHQGSQRGMQAQIGGLHLTREHKVQSGDCIESIALQYGFEANSLWLHDDNADLRAIRSDPHVLAPGDVVMLPEKRLATYDIATARRHRFRRRGVPAKFRVVLEFDGEPRTGLPYVLRVDGGPELSGVTDMSGALEHWISPRALVAELTITDTEIYCFHLARLLPVSDVEGMRSRLRNLGFLARDEESVAEEESDIDDAQALIEFQTYEGLPVTGMLDEMTAARLVARHGS